MNKFLGSVKNDVKNEIILRLHMGWLIHDPVQIFHKCLKNRCII